MAEISLNQQHNTNFDSNIAIGKGCCLRGDDDDDEDTVIVSNHRSQTTLKNLKKYPGRINMNITQEVLDDFFVRLDVFEMMAVGQHAPYTRENFFEKLAQHLLYTGNKKEESGISIRHYLVACKYAIPDIKARDAFNELDEHDDISKAMYSKLFSWFAMIRTIILPIAVKSNADLVYSIINCALDQPDFKKCLDAFSTETTLNHILYKDGIPQDVTVAIKNLYNIEIDDLASFKYFYIALRKYMKEKELAIPFHFVEVNNVAPVEDVSDMCCNVSSEPVFDQPKTT